MFDGSKGLGPKKGLIFLFLDGVGIGTDDATVNPFVVAKTPCLDELSGSFSDTAFRQGSSPSKLVQSIDANLGVAGLPQSATGQATIVTGKNASEVLGRHMGPWPGPTLHKVLNKGTIFDRLKLAEKKLALANAYPQGYFDALAAGKLRLSSLTYALDRAEVRKRNLEDYNNSKAISADLTGAYFAEHSNSVAYAPFEAGECLAKLAEDIDLCVYDFWLSDRAGHRFEFEDCVSLIEQLDAFIAGVVSQIDKTHSHSLLITSDHGNLEDKSTKGHTRNPVPLIVYGEDVRHIESLNSLQDVASLISVLVNRT